MADFYFNQRLGEVDEMDQETGRMLLLREHDKRRGGQMRLRDYQPNLKIRRPKKEKVVRQFEGGIEYLIDRYGRQGWDEVFAHMSMGQLGRYDQLNADWIVDNRSGLMHRRDGAVSVADRKKYEAFRKEGHHGPLRHRPAFFWLAPDNTMPGQQISADDPRFGRGEVVKKADVS